MLPSDEVVSVGDCAVCCDDAVLDFLDGVGMSAD